MPSTALLLLALGLAVSAAVPDVVSRASVTWSDANVRTSCPLPLATLIMITCQWSDELGSMPLGNGDVSMNVWVDQTSGALMWYLAKSDAFDANANPIKVMRLELAFDPPLWTPAVSTFNQTLDVAGASVSITSSQYSVLIFVDANSDTAYVTASSVGSGTFSLTATLDVYRNATVLSNVGMSPP